MWGCIRASLTPGCSGEPAQPAGGAVPVHPGPSGGQQDGSGRPFVDGPLDGSADRRGERDEGDLVALATNTQYPVAVLLAEVFDVAAGGLEDPQAQQPQHRDQREVAWVGRGPGGGEQRLELQVGQSQGRGLGLHVGSADVLGWRVL